MSEDPKTTISKLRAELVLTRQDCETKRRECDELRDRVRDLTAQLAVAVSREPAETPSSSDLKGRIARLEVAVAELRENIRSMNAVVP